MCPARRLNSYRSHERSDWTFLLVLSDDFSKSPLWGGMKQHAAEFCRSVLRGKVGVAPPEKLAAERDKQNQEPYAQWTLGNTPGEQGADDCSRDAPDGETQQKMRVVITQTNFKNAAHKRNSEPKAEIGADNFRRGQSRHSQQQQ